MYSPSTWLFCALFSPRRLWPSGLPGHTSVALALLTVWVAAALGLLSAGDFIQARTRWVNNGAWSCHCHSCRPSCCPICGDPSPCLSPYTYTHLSPFGVISAACLERTLCSPFSPTLCTNLWVTPDIYIIFSTHTELRMNMFSGRSAELLVLLSNCCQQGLHQNTQGQETSMVLGNLYLLKQWQICYLILMSVFA